MNENKRIDNPWIGALKKKTGVESTKKMGLIFSIQNSQLLNWSLPTGEIFQVHGQNKPVANLSIVDFRSEPREWPWNTNK